MGKPTQLPRILLVEDDEDLSTILAMRLKASFSVEVVHASNGLEAVLLLENDPHFVCIISDYHMPRGTGGLVFRFIEERGLKIPFYLLSSAPPSHYIEFQGRKLAGHCVKPTISDLDQLIAPLFKNQEDNQERSKTEYLPMPLKLLSQFKNLPFDCYLEINEKKIVVLKSGTDFNASDYQKYQSKKIKNFLIQSHESSKLVALIQNKLADNLKKSPPIEKSLDAISSTLNLAQELVKFMVFQPKIVGEISETVDQLTELGKKHKNVTQYLNKLEVSSDSYLAQHSTLLSYLAGSLVEYLDIDDKLSARQKLTYAALLHDLSLSDHEVKHMAQLQAETDNKLKRALAPCQNYMAHSRKSAKLLKQLDTVPPGIEQIIVEHHELPTGRGFPDRLNASKISFMACIFIVAEDFADYVLRQKSEGREIEARDYLQKSRRKYQVGHFQSVFKGLEEMLQFSSEKVKAA